MKDLKFSLYEVFGYLLPGYLVMLSLYFLFLQFLRDVEIINIDILFNAKVGFVFGVFSYFAGHAVQGVSNIILKGITIEKILKNDGCSSWGGINGEMIESAKGKIEKLFLMKNVDDLKLNEVLKICDAYVVQNGNTEEREIYVYREGFYRGMFLSIIVSLLPLSVFGFTGGGSFILGSKEIVFSRLDFVVFFVLAGFSVWLSFERYKRFFSYRVEHSISSFVFHKAGK